MGSRYVQISAIIAACLIGVGVRADDKPDRPKKDGDRPHKDGEKGPDGRLPKFALAHAAELSLTDEQKQKLEAMLKFMEEHRGDGERKKGGGGDIQRPEGPDRILTEEQRAKLKELLIAEKGDRPDRPKGDRPKGDRPKKGDRPNGDAK